MRSRDIGKPRGIASRFSAHCKAKDFPLVYTAANVHSFFRCTSLMSLHSTLDIQLSMIIHGNVHQCTLSCPVLSYHCTRGKKPRKQKWQDRQMQACTHLSCFALVSGVFPGRYAKKYTGYCIVACVLTWWRVADSNRRPSACESDALTS